MVRAATSALAAVITVASFVFKFIDTWRHIKFYSIRDNINLGIEEAIKGARSQIYRLFWSIYDVSKRRKFKQIFI